MPPETSGVGREVKQRKFGPSTAKGVFLGYALDTGMKWRKAFRVAPLSAFRMSPMMWVLPLTSVVCGCRKWMRFLQFGRKLNRELPMGNGFPLP